MANEVINRRLNIYIDSAGAEKALDTLTKKEKELQATIDKSAKSGKDFRKEMAQLADTQSKIGQIKDVLDGKVLPSVKMAEAAVKRLRNELRQMPADSKAAADKFQEFKKAEATLAQVKKQFTEVRQETKGFGGVLDTAFGMFLGGGLLQAVNSVAGQMKQFLTDSIGEALQAEQNTARLKATLDNVGRSDAFDSLAASANRMAEQFKFIDNDDVIGVFEQLITYGKLTEKQIQELTPVIIDFAAKQQISLSESASVVVKALEGNGKALKEYGIDIKDAKTVTEAFGAIMTELKPRVEGAAAAFGETTAGQIAITRQEIKNLQEEIGTELLPALKNVLTFVSGAIQQIGGLFRFIKNGVGSVFSNGGLNVGAALDDAKQRQGDILSSFISLSGEEQDKRIEESKANLRRLGKAIREAANEEQKKAFTELFNQEAAFKQQLQSMQKSQGVGGSLLGLGGNMNLDNSAEEARKKAAAEAEAKAKKAREELARLAKDWTEFFKRIEVEGTAVDAPVLAAFIDLDNKVKEQTDKIAEFLKKGIITPEQAKEATDFVQKIYEAQAEAIRKKFETIRVPVELAPPDLSDLEYGLDVFTKKIQQKITEVNKPIADSTGNAALDWLGKKDENGGTNEDKIKAWSALASDAATTIMQVRIDSEQRAFDIEMRNFERRKIADKKLLDSKVINQKEYDRRSAALERQQQARELQFRRTQFELDKKQKTASALLSLPSVILSTLDKFGPPIPPNILGIAAMAFTVATSAIQIAAIQSAKPPAFAKGGFVPNGPSHAAGGISLVDNRSGSKVGEVEGGEPILSRATYRQNRPLIDALLNASQNNGGSFSPSWASDSPRGINIGRISSSMSRLRRYADGGVIATVPGEDNGNDRMNALLTALMQKLDQPLRAYTVLTDIEDQSARITAIRKNGMIS